MFQVSEEAYGIVMVVRLAPLREGRVLRERRLLREGDRYNKGTETCSTWDCNGSDTCSFKGIIRAPKREGDLLFEGRG